MAFLVLWQPTYLILTAVSSKNHRKSKRERPAPWPKWQQVFGWGWALSAGSWVWTAERLRLPAGCSLERHWKQLESVDFKSKGNRVKVSIDYINLQGFGRRCQLNCFLFLPTIKNNNNTPLWKYSSILNLTIQIEHPFLLTVIQQGICQIPYLPVSKGAT